MFCRGRVYVFYLYAEDDWPTLEPCRAVLSRQAYYMDRGEGGGAVCLFPLFTKQFDIL